MNFKCSNADLLFCVHDNVSDTMSHFGLAPSKGAYVRNVLPLIRVPLRDVVPCQVVNYDNDEGSFYLDDFSWDVYKYPETKMESLEPLHLSEEEKKEIESKE